MLTAAVVRRLAQGMQRVETIRAGIAPSPFAGVGENVIRAIASYAGQRVALRKNGVTSHGFPFTEHARFTIAPPGRLPLRSTVVLARRCARSARACRALARGRQRVDGSGPRARGAAPRADRVRTARALEVGAVVVAAGALDAARDESAALGRASRRHVRCRHGPQRRGRCNRALVAPPCRGRRRAVDSVDGGRSHRSKMARWSVAAAAGRAPRRASSSSRTTSGRSRGGRIHWGIREGSTDGPLYARLLGAAWNDLPAEIRGMHDWQGPAEARGTADVDRGTTLMARARREASWAFLLPRSKRR